ncbi:MAG: glutamine-hydrolyzing carbamoyl-phosphate synthase small subunit [Acidobacteriota bacterium]|nr:glutamine-hydrolyzing carbamoyl-phosphate synthase small subunit [Acidobacteriota bacterium]
MPRQAKCAKVRKILKDKTTKYGVLALKDGTVFEGKGFGACARTWGEVVFNTGMVGYVESITDPSYHGQILVQTYPLIGNYGVNPDFFESSRPWIKGYAVSEYSDQPSHHTSCLSIDRWLEASRIPAISCLDTRALVKRLRQFGVIPGLLAVSDRPLKLSPLVREASRLPDPNASNLVAEVSSPDIHVYKPGCRKRIVLIDCGTKLAIIRHLTGRGLSVIRVPQNTPAEKVLSFKPDGVVISNGPGNPELCSAVETVSLLLTENLPLLGICLGHQILALAAGARTYKLKFGHRSQNQPCLETGTSRCYLTSQNHGFAVDQESLPSGWKPWLVNANDGTNEGIKHKHRPFFGVQFHPEACPGPTDTTFIFNFFVEQLG